MIRPEAALSDFIFRGTTIGWPGNPAPQQGGFTSTSSDPLVATLFALECRRMGQAVVWACERSKLEQYIRRPNVLAELESEVAVSVAPLKFVELFQPLRIDVDDSLARLKRLGFEMPEVIADKHVLRNELGDKLRLNKAQIVEYIRFGGAP